VLCSSQDHLGTSTRDLYHPVLATVENNDNWHVRKGDLLCVFPPNVPMVPSSVLIVTFDGEHLTCCGFSLGETTHFGSFKFIVDYFSGQSLSARRGYIGAAFMGSTRTGTPSTWWVMIEDSTEEILTVSSGEGGSDLPSPRRHGMGAPFAPVTTTPWIENALAT
jgi:hypothetical protein